MTRRGIFALALLGPALLLVACRSSRIEITVQNHSGGTVDLLEVSYPSASFGADHLTDGSDLVYPVQVRGTGAVRVQYTDAATHSQVQAFGAYLNEHQSGRLTIELRPGGAIHFQPELSPAR